LTVTHLKEVKCIACGVGLKGASGFDEGTKPSPGDISICADCGEIQQFDENMQFRKPREGWDKDGGEELVKLLIMQKLIQLQNAGAIVVGVIRIEK